MRTVVIDASVAAKWFLEEDDTIPARRLIHPGVVLHAPDHLLLELDSVLCKRMRRREIPPEEADVVRQGLRRMPLLLHPFGALLEPAFALACEGKCSIYDALYVVLAEMLQTQMVTADRRLCRSLAGDPLAKHILWIGDLRMDEQTPLEPSP